MYNPNIIRLRKSKSEESAGNSGAGYGVKSTVDVAQLEKAQVQSID